MKVSIPKSVEWQTKRKAYLEEYFYHEWSEREFSKTHQQALEAWFLHGELSPLLDCKPTDADDSWNLVQIMKLCPAQTADEYFEVMKFVSAWLSERGLDYWDGSTWQENRDEKFFGRFVTGAFVGSNYFTNPELMRDRITKVFKQPGEDHIIFPFSLGVDNWVPEWHIDLPRFVQSILIKLGRFLFNDREDSREYEASVELVPYILPILNTLDEKYWNLTLSDDGSIKAGQSLMRAFFSNLHGYQTIDNKEPLQHHNPKIEQVMRDAFENANMPDSYHKFIEFIHTHKEYAIDPDYVENDEPFY